MSTQDIWPIAVEKIPEQKPAYSVKDLLPALIIGTVIGGLFYYYDKIGMAFIVWPISAFLFLCGLLAPCTFKKIEHGLQVFARFVGKGLTVILLVPFYYLVFFPGRIFLKLKGKDPMHREFPTQLESYWTTRKPIEDAKVHFGRQY